MPILADPIVNQILESVLNSSVPAFLERRKKYEQLIEENPDKAKPVWDLATNNLQRYIDENLIQIRQIYRISLRVMVAGFVLLIMSFLSAIVLPPFGIDTLTPVLIAGAGGVITELIGASFLVVYRSALEHSTNYINTLDKSNSVGVAVQLLDTVSDADNENLSKEEIAKAKIELAKLLLSQK